MKIKRGDKVLILLGKNRGKEATVEKVLLKHGQVLVPGVNVVKRHVGKRATGAEGGIIEIAKPIDISNVALICPNCGKATRVKFRKDGGIKLRICLKCGKEFKDINVKTKR